jgi:hypothetical protein
LSFQLTPVLATVLRFEAVATGANVNLSRAAVQAEIWSVSLQEYFLAEDWVWKLA